jgi:hypothetical protein
VTKIYILFCAHILSKYVSPSYKQLAPPKDQQCPLRGTIHFGYNFYRDFATFFSGIQQLNFSIMLAYV